MVAPPQMWVLGEVALQEEEEDLEAMSALEFQVLMGEMTSQVLGVEEEIISVSEDLVEEALGESIALEVLKEVVEALIEVDLLEYKVLVEVAWAVDKVPVGVVKAFVVLEGMAILVEVLEVLVEGGVSTVANLVRASTLVVEETLVMIPQVKTLDLE